VAAAFTDPRSQPFRAEWVPELGVEVTLLSPLEPLHFTGEADALRQIVPAVDGLVLRYGPCRGTFLPQVWESLPAAPDFLAELKVKAGLDRAFWAEGVEIHRFRVQKWGAHDRRIALPGPLVPPA
jgi:AmmeMemoRadiSam system protein A